MASLNLLANFRDALVALVDLDEDGVVDAWGVRAVFDLDGIEGDFWDELDAESPPTAYTLLIRLDDQAREMVWQADEDEDDVEDWPVVRITPEGETEVLAPSLKVWLYALLYTGGQLGGGTEDDLVGAREDASRPAMDLSLELLDELDLAASDPAWLGEQYEEAQEEWMDAWADAAEGLE